jgi:acyl-CoA hydrolase
MRTVDVDQLAAHLPPLPGEPRIVASGNFAIPRTALAALDAALPAYRLNLLNAHGELPQRDGVVMETSFVGPAMRGRPDLSYVPCRLSLVPALFARAMPPDVVLLHTSTPRHGVVSLGIEVNVMPAAIEACQGTGREGDRPGQSEHAVHVWRRDRPDLSSIDVLFEADEPLTVATQGTLDDTSRDIGDRIAARIKDGSTLQMGIGAVPDAVLNALQSRKGLRFWTEMFSDGVLALDKATAPWIRTPPWPCRSCSAPWSSTNGSTATPACAWCAPRPATTPALIAQQPLMTSVNSALQVDLFAQANASRINARIYSGFGGQTDFIVGALHAPGGQAFIALRSWHPKANVSTIVPLVDEPVTSFQHTAVITEQGIAEVWGRSQDEQARNLITQAAHPDVREELFEEAAEPGAALTSAGRS